MTAPARNKYCAKRIEFDGFMFDSKAEAKRWGELKLLQSAGKISGLLRQVPFDLCFPNRNGEIVKVLTPTGRCMKYVADFSYTQDNRTIYEDVKGVDTPVSAIKRAMVLAFYGINVEVWS